MKLNRKFWVALILNLSGSALFAQSTEYRFRILSLFQPDRIEDLRQVVQELPDITLVDISFETAIATFQFDSRKVFPGAKTLEQIVGHLRNRLRGESQGAFEALPLCMVPKEQLKELQIPIIGLDCKGCSYAAYLAIYKIEGVEYATASFKDGLVFARVNPTKTNRGALEEALIKKHVTLKNEVIKSDK
jgi:copper chaperone CopZ